MKTNWPPETMNGKGVQEDCWAIGELARGSMKHFLYLRPLGLLPFLAPLLLVGCMELAPVSSGHDRPHLVVETTRTIAQPISAIEAARLAAKLANDECERKYHERPFVAEQHSAVIEDDRYRWGEDDTKALWGTFALVTFDLDGRNPTVILYHYDTMY
ncbi:MAG: hypothetical protein WCO56_20965 [Verrucomicrobiota bacterium]